MKVLVTGGLGFVAVHVVRLLLDAGHEVTVVDRDGPTPDHRAFLAGHAGRLTLVRADLTGSAAEWADSLDRPDAVVHAAAMTPLAPGTELSSTPAAAAVNVLASAQLLELARAWRVRRMLHISSGSVYGRPAVSEIDEACPPAPRNVYGITKAAADLLVQRYAELGACDAVVARLSQPYGPMERTTGSRTALSPVHDWITAALAGRPLAVEPGGLDRGRDYLYVRDVADALVRLLVAQRPAHRVYNVSNGVRVTLRELLQHVVATVGDTGTVEGLVHLSAEAERPVLTPARLTADTGWTATTDLASGIAQTADWLRSSRSSVPAEVHA
jgi:UDP-glucose 4-epimerase